MAEENLSLWLATSTESPHRSLDRDLEVDVAIVGAGITGITGALLLARAGKKVALLEMGAVASGESGRTTAHLTEAIDTRYPTLQRDFGKEGALLAANASRAAIEQIATLISELKIDCEFQRVPGFLYSERSSDLDDLQSEAQAASESGVKATFTKSVPLPFLVQGAVRYEQQAQFHPARYLRALAEEAVKTGVALITNTQVLEIHDGEPCSVVTASHTVRARDVIVAANVPINNRVFMHTKLAAYRTYAVASPVAPDFLAPGLYWDTDDPYHYTRTQIIDGQTYLIVGGADHKTGTKVDTEESYAAMEQYARERFAVAQITHRWSGQIIEPVDGLAFIGRNSLSRHIYIGTGYGGQGMTFGTLAAMINSDLILEKANPYAALFAATRVKPIASAVDYIAENVDFPKYFLAQHLSSFDQEDESVDSLVGGEGKILKVAGKKVAAYRDGDGALHLLSPVCPHLQCDVRFNDAEKSWDCPCHGSRFTGEGKLINGPAMKDLDVVEEGGG